MGHGCVTDSFSYSLPIEFCFYDCIRVHYYCVPGSVVVPSMHDLKQSLH